MSVQRLVQFDNFDGKLTPLDFLARLRALLPAVELVYVGEGRWWLGRVLRTDAREKAGRAILAAESKRTNPNPRNVALAKLSVQGFARIEEYREIGNGIAGRVTDMAGEPCTIEDDLRERLWHQQQDGGEAKMRERLGLGSEEAHTEAANRAMQHYLATDGLAHYRSIVRDRKTFGHGGMTGGAERTLTTGSRSGLILPPGYE